MARELKFRAWSKKENKFYFYSGIFNQMPFIETSTFTQYESIKKFDTLEPPQQFTGLYDKTGREIYEGDIVSVDLNSPHEPEIMTVEYGGKYEYAAFGITGERKPGMFGANPTWDMINPSYAKDMTVIGNIYEKPLVNE